MYIWLNRFRHNENRGWSNGKEKEELEVLATAAAAEADITEIGQSVCEHQGTNKIYTNILRSKATTNPIENHSKNKNENGREHTMKSQRRINHIISLAVP